MLQTFGDSYYAIIVEKKRFDSFQIWKSIEFSYIIVGKVYRVKLILQRVRISLITFGYVEQPFEWK